MVGTTFISYIGKTLASQIVSWIPAIGTATKVVVNTTVAASITAVLGAGITLIAEQYLIACINNGGIENLPFAEFLTKEKFSEIMSYVQKHKAEFGLDDIISQIVESINNPITIEEDNSNDEIIPENSSLFFFEDQGRKEAINLLSNIINRIDEKSTLLIITESELEWLLEDYQFSKNIQQRIFKTLSRGFQIHQILPSLTNINRLIESLKFWMPIYASGQSMVYYYPRIRDNLVKRSIIVVPNHAALVTTNISSINRNYATLLTTDLKLVDTYARQYEDYLSLCRPAFQFEKQIYRFMDYFEEIYNNNCDVIQFTNCISINSFTYELAEIVCKKGLDKYNINAEYFKKMINETNKHLNKNRLIDLFYLPTCQEVIDGKAMILS